MRFRKKPVVIEAVQWTGNNRAEVLDFLGDEDGHIVPLDGFGDHPYTYATIINTLEGPMSAKAGDWIICGIRGEFYPCKPDIFEATYELVASGDPPIPGGEP